MKRNFFLSFNFFLLFIVVLSLYPSKINPAFAQSCGGTYRCSSMVPDGFGGYKCPDSGGGEAFPCAIDSFNNKCQPPVGPCGAGGGPAPCLTDVTCGTTSPPAPTIADDPYNYTKCPSGKSLSCGPATEAEAQNKQFCGYRITCNKYFWPSSIDMPAPCNSNPVSATCDWNCSCCPTGSSRTCSLGGNYIKNITIDMAWDTPQREALKVTCDTHDDILDSNWCLERDGKCTYENQYGDKLQDWRLFCRTNTCNCVAPTATPTPTPWIQVNVKNSTGGAVNSSQICGVDCSSGVCVPKPTGSVYCSSGADNSFTFPKFTATNTYLGGRIALTDNLLRPLVVVGVTPSVAGFAESTCNGIGGYCYIWNKNSWTTGGRTVDFVVASPTPTQTTTPTQIPTATPTQIPGVWTKLKNTSFISNNTLTSNIPLVPVAYDTDDSPADVNFIRDSAGVVAAPVINITGVNVNAKTGSPEYKATGYSPSYLMTPSSFLAYIKARKQHKVITSLGQITADGIYIWDGTYPLPINDSNKIRFDNYKVVFIATGQVNINTDTGLDPTNGSLAIIAPTITFTNIVEEVNGIFIANNISTGSPADQGLKIVGNLIAFESLINDREWTNSNKPSLFIVFDQEKYVDLLPYLSTANYDWRQIQ